jgi:hypothetical protein
MMWVMIRSTGSLLRDYSIKYCKSNYRRKPASEFSATVAVLGKKNVVPDVGTSLTIKRTSCRVAT